MDTIPYRTAPFLRLAQFLGPFRIRRYSCPWPSPTPFLIWIIIGCRNSFLHNCCVFGSQCMNLKCIWRFAGERVRACFSWWFNCYNFHMLIVWPSVVNEVPFPNCVHTINMSSRLFAATKVFWNHLFLKPHLMCSETELFWKCLPGFTWKKAQATGATVWKASSISALKRNLPPRLQPQWFR